MSITEKISKMVNKEYKIFSELDYDRYRWYFRNDVITINRYEHESDANAAAKMMVESGVISQAEVKPVTIFKKDAVGDVCKYIYYDMIFDGRDIYYYKNNKSSYSDEEYHLALNEYIKVIKAIPHYSIHVVGWH